MLKREKKTVLQRLEHKDFRCISAAKPDTEVVLLRENKALLKYKTGVLEKELEQLRKTNK